MIAHEIPMPSANEIEKDILFEELKLNRVLDSISALESVVFILLLILFNFWINQTKKSKKKMSTRTILESLPFEFNPSHRRFSKFALILIFYKLFITFIQQFLCNSIQTKKTLIDRTRIIAGLDEIIDANYKFCFFRDSDLSRIVKDVPKTNILRRLYENPDRCVLNLSSQKEQCDFTNKAVLIDPTYFRLILALYMKEKEGAQYWQSQPLQSVDNPLVIYCRSELTRAQISLINRFVLAKFETGLHHYVYDLR